VQGGHRDACHHTANQDRRGEGARARKWCCTVIRIRTPTGTRGAGKTGRHDLCSPYDDRRDRRQGTIAMEILRQQHPADQRSSAHGGGGLAAVWRLRQASAPEIKIIVCSRSIRCHVPFAEAKRRVTLDHVGLFADGVAVKQVGQETFRLCRKLVDEIILVIPTPPAPRSRTYSKTPARSSNRRARSPSPAPSCMPRAKTQGRDAGRIACVRT